MKEKKFECDFLKVHRNKEIIEAKFSEMLTKKLRLYMVTV